MTATDASGCRTWGSVRMTRPLPEGIPYEVTISKRNGRWYASVAYWKAPMAPPQRETQSVGGVDVGINPLAIDSSGVGNCCRFSLL